jgi:hypothetical protein
VTWARFPAGAENLSLPPRPNRLWGSTQPPIQWILGSLILEVKIPVREGDILLLPKLGMCGAIPPLPRNVIMAWWLLSNVYGFMAWYLVKHRDNFYFKPHANPYLSMKVFCPSYKARTEFPQEWWICFCCLYNQRHTEGKLKLPLCHQSVQETRRYSSAPHTHTHTHTHTHRAQQRMTWTQ